MNWKLVSLKSVTVDVPNWNPTRHPEDEFIYVDISSINNQTFQITNPKRLLGSNAPSRARRPIRDGDVIFSNVRTYLRNVAQVGGLPQPAVASTGFSILRPGDRLDSRYLFHLARSNYFIDKVTPQQTGTQYPATSERVVRDQLIPLPPRPIQEEIAKVIDLVESKRGSFQERLPIAQQAIERLRYVMFSAACSGRLTADWRQQHPGIESAETVIERSRGLLTHRNKAGSESELTSSSAWPELPESWRWVSLRSLAEIKGGIQKQPKRAPRRNSYPYLRVANVLRGRLDLSEVHRFELFNGELEAFRLEPNDLLIVEGNGSASEIGRSALWNGEIEDCVHQNHIIRVRSVVADPRFIELFWNSPIGSREIAALAVTSAGLYSLSTKKIGSVLVPVPPLDEQREIVRRVHQLLEVADRLAQRVEAASRRVDRSSQALLAKAFRGELIPMSDQSSLEIPPRRPKGVVDWNPVPASGSVSDLIER